MVWVVLLNSVTFGLNLDSVSFTNIIVASKKIRPRQPIINCNLIKNDESFLNYLISNENKIIYLFFINF